MFPPLVFKLLFPLCLRARGGDWGSAMLNLTADSEIVVPKPKHTMLPVLVVLFLLSYGLMTMLIVEQGRTIDTQRFLIRQLFTDSTQLSAMKGADVQKQNQGKAHAHGQNSPAPAAPAAKSRTSHNTSKLQQIAPQKPPKAASDAADERRSLVTI
jgi:hypothetical protein